MKYIYTGDELVKMDTIDAFELDYIRVPYKNNKLTELKGIVGVKYFGVETIDELKEFKGVESKRKFMITSYDEPEKLDERAFLAKYIKAINEMPDGGVIECVYDEDNILQIREW